MGNYLLIYTLVPLKCRSRMAGAEIMSPFSGRGAVRRQKNILEFGDKLFNLEHFKDGHPSREINFLF